MKSSEIRALSVEAIRSRLEDAKEELMRLRFQQATGELSDTSRLQILRRDIARMNTILNVRLQVEKEGEA
jgi:large subunit ribosomal protein L29